MLRANGPWQVICGDIAEVSTAAILGVGNLEVEEADVLIGGPPCQPFSKAGYWASGDPGRLLDPRAFTLGAYMRVAREGDPKHSSWRTLVQERREPDALTPPCGVT